MNNYQLVTKRNLVLLVSLLVLILVFTFWGKQILSSFIEYWDIIGGVLVPLALVAYTNKKVYLFIQRHFILPFKVSHADWSFLYSCITQKENAFSVAKQSLKDIFSDVKIMTDATNKFTFMVNGKIIYYLSFEEDTSGWRLTFKSSKETIPTYQYDSKLRDIVGLITKIDGCSEPDTKPNFSLTINFPQRNPYFGFLIQNLPQEYIKDFRVNISLPQSDSNLMASKNELTVNTTNPMVLEKIVVDYLTFSPNFACSAL